MADPAESSRIEVVPMSTHRADRLRDEYSELFAATYPQVVRTVWFVVHDRGMAEETAQDAFAAVNGHIGSDELVRIGADGTVEPLVIR